MKKILLLIGLVVSVVLGASAADYEMFIKKGLEWKEYCMTSSPEPPAYDHLPKYIDTYVLDREVEYNGETVLVLSEWGNAICCEQDQQYAGNEKKEIAYIKTDGDKVYYHPLWEENPEWYLMYDFGLGIDEGCDVFDLVTYKVDLSKHSSYVWCKEITENVIGGRTWQVMEMGERCVNMLGEEGECENTGRWLRGLGSDKTFTWPNNFDPMDGGSFQLIEASLNGEIIYQNYPAGVEMTEAEPLQVRVQGNQVQVLGVSGRSEVYTTDGRLAGSTYDDQPVTLSTGLYIIRHGNKSHKVVL